MFITRLRLRNWKNFQEADVPLRQRTFVVGPNASGKSNLLDAIRFLRDVSSHGLQAALGDRGGISKVRSLSARSAPEVEIGVELSQSPDAPALWTYTLAVRREPAGRRRPLVSREVVKSADGSVILKRPTADDEADGERLTQTHLEQVFANREFRAIADFLRSVEYLHLVPQMIRNGHAAGHSAVGQDPYGLGILERIAETPAKRRQSKLAKIGKQLHQILPQFDEHLTIARDARGQPHLEARCRHWAPDAGRQREDQFSDGMLRLIGLLWALMDGSGPLLLEEPELSLQSDVVQQLAPMFAGTGRRHARQILVTTHSPDLLQDEGIAPSEILIVAPSKDGSIVALGSEDAGAVEIAKIGGGVGDILLASAVHSGGARLPLKV